MSRADYYKATNSAYSVLGAFKINAVPVNLDLILNKLPNLRLMSYTRFATLNNIHLGDIITDHDEFGSLTLRPHTRQYLMLYNDTKSPDVIRFTLGHELGHYFLDHKKHTAENDKEANCFARNLLCPLPILDLLSSSNYFSIPSIFGISFTAALTRLNFINLDRYHLNSDLYNSIYSMRANFFSQLHLNGATLST